MKKDKNDSELFDVRKEGMYWDDISWLTDHLDIISISVQVWWMMKEYDWLNTFLEYKITKIICKIYAQSPNNQIAVIVTILGAYFSSQNMSSWEWIIE